MAVYDTLMSLTDFADPFAHGYDLFILLIYGINANGHENVEFFENGVLDLLGHGVDLRRRQFSIHLDVKTADGGIRAIIM